MPYKSSCASLDEARRIKSIVEAVKLSASNGEDGLVTGIPNTSLSYFRHHTMQVVECEILKIGPLTFVSDVSSRLSYLVIGS